MNKRTQMESGRDAGLPDAHTATAVVEVKKGLSAVRNLRDGLVQLAVLLAEHPGKRGYLLLVEPQLSAARARGELARFQAAMRPDIAHRLRVIVANKGQITESREHIPGEDWDLLRRSVEGQEDSRTALPSPDKTAEVFLVILHQWFLGKGPMTARWIGETVGCNYRTVSAAVDRLGSAIKRGSDRRIRLKYFPEEAWTRLLAVAPKVRATKTYADGSDQPRSVQSLMARLRRLGRTDTSVGGVMGAERHDPALDIVGAPRMDLCVHAPEKYVDLDFVNELDPALEPTRDPERPVRLALHFVRRKDPMFERGPEGLSWADPVQCLLDLYEARLTHQASGFEQRLSMRGGNQSDQS